MGIPALPAGATLDAAPDEAASGAPVGPTYDAQANVGRNPDGSIVYIGQPSPEGSPGAGGTEVNVSASANPDAIAAWLKAHPDDPANRVQAQTATPGATASEPPGGQAVPVLPQGATLDTPGADAQPPPAGVAATAQDVGRGALAGVERGAVGALNQAKTAALSTMLGGEGVFDGVTNWLGQNLVAPGLAAVTGTKPEMTKAIMAAVLKKPTAAGLPGGDYQPTTTAGQYAETAGEFLPAAAFGEGADIPARAMQVLAPAIASETAGQVTKGTSLETPARLIAAILGGAASGPKLAPSPAAAELGARADTALSDLSAPRTALPDDIRARVDAAIAAGKNPRQAASRAAADSLPVKVPLTKGQETGEPGQQLFENLSLRGSHGVDAQRMMRGFAEEQQGALRGNTHAIAARIAGRPALGRGEGGAEVSDALNKRFDAMHREVDQAYDAAREGTGDAALHAYDAEPLSVAVRAALRDFDPIRIPSVMREMDRLADVADATNGLGVKAIFEARARLTKLRASNDGVEATAAGTAVKALDHMTDRALRDDLFSGDPDAIGRWRDAIAKRRDFGKLFEGNDLVNKLTARVRRGEGRDLAVDPGDAANYIFGRSNMGFVGRQNLYRDLTRLRSVLGADSHAWNAIRGEAFQRVADAGEGVMENGTRQFSGAKFAKAWSDLETKDPRLLGRLFTPEERNIIERFAKVSTKATSPVRGGDNPSNSGVTIMRLMRELPFIPFVRAIPFVGEHIIEGIEHGVSVRQTSKAINPKLEPATKGLPRLIRSGPAAMAAVAQAQQGR